VPSTGVDEKAGETVMWFAKAAEGALPLIIDLWSTDLTAVLLNPSQKSDESGKFGSKVFESDQIS
jgi:hypothetical protein